MERLLQRVARYTAVFALGVVCALLSTQQLQQRLDASNFPRMHETSFQTKQHKLDGVAEPRTRPTFYLHVGPHKTATTFLQSSLCENIDSARSLYVQDNLVYMGSCYMHTDDSAMTHETSFCAFADKPASSYMKMIRQGYANRSLESSATAPALSTKQAKFHPPFLSLIESLRPTGHHVLMSDEGCGLLSSDQIEKLKSLLSPTWDVKVLVVHRHFHDWLVSWHNWVNRFDMKIDSTWDKQLTPFDLNRRCTGTAIVEAIEAQKEKYHPSQLIQSLYQTHFDNVDLIPLDGLRSFLPQKLNQSKYSDFEDAASESQCDPLLEYVLCNWIQAANSCKQARQGNLVTTMRNPSMNNTFHWIAQLAHDQGLIPDNSTRRTAARLIQSLIREEKKESELPVKCPSNQTLDRIYRLSVEVDSKVFGWTKEREVFHTESWHRMVSDNKLCFVDSETLLQDPDLRDKIRQLNFSMF